MTQRCFLPCSSRGTTLIEALAALAILSMATLAIMTLMISSIRGRHADVQQMEIVRQQADTEELESMRERAALQVSEP